MKRIFLTLICLPMLANSATYNLYFNNTEQDANSTASPSVSINTSTAVAPSEVSPSAGAATGVEPGAGAAEIQTPSQAAPAPEPSLGVPAIANPPAYGNIEPLHLYPHPFRILWGVGLSDFSFLEINLAINDHWGFGLMGLPGATAYQVSWLPKYYRIPDSDDVLRIGLMAGFLFSNDTHSYSYLAGPKAEYFFDDRGRWLLSGSLLASSDLVTVTGAIGFAF